MHDDMGFIIRSVVQVGRAVPPPEPGRKAPIAATADVYEALRRAAPLSLDELAAILCGWAPFDVEPNDDLATVQDWTRVLQRLKHAARLGEIPLRPTLREGVGWALKVGCSMVNRADLLSAAGLQDDQSKFPPSTRSMRRSEHDPDLQKLADEIANELRVPGRQLSKKRVVEEMQRRHKLGIDEQSIVRRIRRDW